jgi:glycosyltransferase involved in cell wall biosynthesis
VLKEKVLQMLDQNKDIAVVIGFRDWGLDRLSVAVSRLSQSSIASAIDIVVSDYGSADALAVDQAVQAVGGRVVRSEPIGPWSRARALNAGVRGTSTKYAITTDSDMIFSPEAVENLLALLEVEETAVHLIQCRDLTERFDANRAALSTLEDLEANSFFRPRWGMGGMIAFRRSDFDRIGGYDERMEIYGGEDIDFAQRLTRAGLRLNWVDEPETRIFHIWHPPTRDTVAADPVQLAAQQRNREIMLHDASWVRNVNIGNRAAPAASVLIATRGRSKYLMDSINSSLSQTVQDVELIIMDDGSEDETPDILAAIDDPRVRTMRQEPLGVAAARNKLVDAARSAFIVVHDDDDIMLPWRIEAHFNALHGDLAATYGGWVDFDTTTGETEIIQGRDYVSDAFMYTGKILAHGTSMFRTEILRRYRYREFLTAGVDFNLITRLANAGFKFKHTGHLHILRRMHDMNLTHVSKGTQKNAATRITQILGQRDNAARTQRFREIARNLPTISCQGVSDLAWNTLSYLPDHLVKRSVTLTDASKEQAAKALDLFPNANHHYLVGWSDEMRLSLLGLSLADLVELRRAEISFTVETVIQESEKVHKTARAQRPEKSIVPVLPTSGLLDDECVNLITITPVASQALPAIDEVGARVRVWSSDHGDYAVKSRHVDSVEEAISRMSKDKDAILLVHVGANVTETRLVSAVKK